MKFGRYTIMGKPTKFDLEIDLIRENEKLIVYLNMINLHIIIKTLIMIK